jgi:ribosomal 30S subunit maturation factor RimM
LSKDFPEALLLIGRVIGPHGVRGLLKIESYARSEDTLLTAGNFSAAEGENSEWVILSAVLHKALIRLEAGSEDRPNPIAGGNSPVKKRSAG